MALNLRTFFVCYGRRYVLSTVKLLAWLDDEPYETMVFPVNQRGEIVYSEVFCNRYSTAAEAEAAHHHYVDLLSQGIKFWD